MSTARERAYSGIREAILEGSLRPGKQLKEEELAAQFGISRTPIRQAIQKLSEEGLVSVRENKRSYVVDVDELDLEELFDILSFLEAYAARRAASRITDEQLDYLKRLHEQMVEIDRTDSTNDGAFLQVNSHFHEALHQAAASNTLFAMLRRVADFPVAVYLKYDQRTENEAAIHHHSQIIKALEMRDPAMAALEMQVHIEYVRRECIALAQGISKD